MNQALIRCPYCQGTSPSDARFCIECSAPLIPASTHTTHRLVLPPQPVPPARQPVRVAQLLSRCAVAMLLGALLYLAILTNRNSPFDNIARLLLIIGGVHLTRQAQRGQVVAALRAAVLCLALVLALITPWWFTITVATGVIVLLLSIAECLSARPSNHAP